MELVIMKESLRSWLKTCIQKNYLYNFFMQILKSFFSCWYQQAVKQAKNVLLACFRAYVGQPHDHIRWARPMPFASCNPTNPRTNLWNFHEKFLRIGDFEKWPFLKNGHFGFFFQKKKKFFLLHSHENQSKFSW